MKTGRPTVATPENIDRAIQYLSDWRSVDVVIPTVEGLAVYLDISKDTLYERQEFSDVIRAIKAMQGEMLINKSLKGDFNANIAKLMLSSKHGYVEKTQTDITTKGESINTDPDKAAAYAKYLKDKE